MYFICLAIGLSLLILGLLSTESLRVWLLRREGLYSEMSDGSIDAVKQSPADTNLA